MADKKKKKDDDNNNNPDFIAFGESPTDDTTGDCGASHVCVGPTMSMRGYCRVRGSHRVHLCVLCGNEFL